MVQGYYNYNNPYSQYRPVFKADKGFLSTPINKVTDTIESGVDPFVDPNEKPSKKKKRRRIIAASSTVLVLGALTMLANPRGSGKAMAKLKKLQAQFELKMHQNKDKFLKSKLYEFGKNVTGTAEKGMNVYFNLNSGKDIVIQEMCINANKKYPEFITKNETLHKIVKKTDEIFVKIFEKPHKKITEWFDSISIATVKKDYRKANADLDLLNEELKIFRNKLSKKDQATFDKKLQEIMKSREAFDQSTMLNRLAEQGKMMEFLPEDLWNKMYNKKDGFAKNSTNFWVRDSLIDQKALVEQEGEKRIAKLFGNKDKKGLYDEIVDLCRKNLNEEEIKLLEKDMAQSLKKLKKANESECAKYFDKKRDLVVGSAPTDILTQIFGLGICSWAVSRAEKEDRVQTLVTKGLPIITGLGSSLVFSALLFPAGPSLIAGVGVSAVTGVVCHLINKYIFGNHDDEIADNQNTTQNNSINNQTNPANPQSQLKGVIYA